MGDSISHAYSYIDPLKSLQLALKDELPGPIYRRRGMRLADHGVNIIQMVKAELHNQFPGDAPTDDQVKAAVFLSLLDGFNVNVDLPPVSRIPVSKYN